ncbi:ssDNA-binding protein [Novosphingobium resinovorum]|uniref:DUF2815 family protein n=1 Tax=Novosphingobium resinovorum TaxID=158500 RepID=A0A1D8A374_9SPHN|nr:ssDNA-binding protein [Novosphingobium resinovorum]AOR76516.1 hypothetical protein BES08_06995 [Novosphingobium resinovorum]
MSTEEKKDDGRTVMLKGVPISFTDSLKDAKPTVKDGVPKHGCNILIVAGSPNEAANKAKIMSAMRAACRMEFGDEREDFFKVISEDDPKRVAYRKGERFKNSETQEVYKGYAGNMVVAGYGPGGSKNPRRPKLFNRRRKQLDEINPATEKPFFTLNDVPEIFYSGCLSDVKVSFYATSHKDQGGNGLFCTIEAIRSHEEGERMAGGSVQTSADEFDDLDDDDDIGGASTTTAAADDDFG